MVVEFAPRSSLPSFNMFANKIIPICFLNIGGISNITIVKDKDHLSKLISKDIGQEIV